MISTLRDLRYAIRSLGETPGFEAIKAQPGVESVAIGTSGAMSGYSSWSPILPQNPDEGFPGWTAKSAVTADYFGALRIPLLAGRVFNAGDNADASRSPIVNRSYARSAFGEDDPTGRMIRLGPERPVAPSDPISIGGATAAMLVVGVAAAYVPARRASRIEPMVALRDQ